MAPTTLPVSPPQTTTSAQAFHSISPLMSDVLSLAFVPAVTIKKVAVGAAPRVGLGPDLHVTGELGVVVSGVVDVLSGGEHHHVDGEEAA